MDIWATLSSRDVVGRPLAGLLALRAGARAFPRRLGVASVADSRRARPLSPGHSGGTAPESHRTSLDHRPRYGSGAESIPHVSAKGAPPAAAPGVGPGAPPPAAPALPAPAAHA